MFGRHMSNYLLLAIITLAACGMVSCASFGVTSNSVGGGNNKQSRYLTACALSPKIFFHVIPSFHDRTPFRMRCFTYFHAPRRIFSLILLKVQVILKSFGQATAPSKAAHLSRSRFVFMIPLDFHQTSSLIFLATFPLIFSALNFSSVLYRDIERVMSINAFFPYRHG